MRAPPTGPGGRLQEERIPTRNAGGSTFAEDPARAAPEARIIWRADLDPGTLRVAAFGSAPGIQDSIPLSRLAPWLTIVRDSSGREHAVLSDGWHRIRVDIEHGSLAASEAVLLHYRLFGTASAEPAILPLRRFLDLCRRGKFARSLFPRDPRIARWVAVLRVHDALVAGASQSEIAAMLVGEGRRQREWKEESGSLRSRVRRLVREARRMAEGGYRGLLQPRR